MALFEWSDRLSVQISSIDEQHKKLVSLVNQAHTALVEGQGNQVVGDIFAELIDYTKYHFAYEEELFSRHGYEETAQHITQHKLLTSRVAAYQQDFNAGKEINVFDVLAFLVDWLQDHIVGSDKKYSSFLVSKGVQ
jgi:hemerythrin-like metal-binding protein